MKKHIVKECTISLTEVIKRLRFFNSKAAELSQFSFWKKATSPDAGAKVSMSPESVSSERIGADLEATAAAVLTLRFWMQRGDGIELGEIVALYNELPVDEDIIHWVNTNYGDHLWRMDGSQRFEVGVDGVKLTQRVLLETFVYGGFAHANEDKRKLYEQLISPPMKAFMEAMFEAAMCDFLRFVFWLAKMNEHSIPALEKIVAGDPDKTVIYFIAPNLPAADYPLTASVGGVRTGKIARLRIAK